MAELLHLYYNSCNNNKIDNISNTNSTDTKVVSATVATTLGDVALSATNQRTANQRRPIFTTYLQESAQEISLIHLHYTHAPRTGYGF